MKEAFLYCFLELSGFFFQLTMYMLWAKKVKKSGLNESEDICEKAE